MNIYTVSATIQYVIEATDATDARMVAQAVFKEAVENAPEDDPLYILERVSKPQDLPYGWDGSALPYGILRRDLIIEDVLKGQP